MPTPIDSPVYYVGPWAANVIDDDGVEWICEVEDGWSASPPVRALVEDKTASDGAWSGPGFFGARVINLSGRARATDRLGMLAAKDRIKAAFNPRSLFTLTVAEAHLTRVATVRLSDQLDVKDQTDQIFAWSLTVVAPDPRRYAEEAVTEQATLPATLTAGRTYSRTYPLVYGGAGGSVSSVFIDQAGNYDETPATITIIGPVVSPRVEHIQSGRSLTFDVTVEYGHTLVLDLLRKTALLDGYANQSPHLSAGSAWFMLVPGVNELAFRGAAGTLPPEADPATVPIMSVTAASAWV